MQIKSEKRSCFKQQKENHSVLARLQEPEMDAPHTINMWGKTTAPAVDMAQLSPEFHEYFKNCVARTTFSIVQSMNVCINESRKISSYSAMLLSTSLLLSFA